MTEYVLQQDNLASGRMVVTLISEFAGLTIPTFHSLGYGQLRERCDVLPGSTDLEQMQFYYKEDYSVYAEGFWGKVLSGQVEIRLMLDDELFFWGTLDYPSDERECLSLVLNSEMYEGVFTLVSVLAKLINTSILSVCDAILPIGEGYLIDYADTNYPWGDPQAGVTAYTVRLWDIMAAIIGVGFSQSIDTGDIDYVENDIEFYDGANWVIFTQLEVFAARDEGGLSYLGYFRNYIEGVSVSGWSLTYPNAYELFLAICKSILAIPRLKWDGSRVGIDLLTRGRDYSASTFPVPEESTYRRSAYVPLIAAEARRNAAVANPAETNIIGDSEYVYKGASGTGTLSEAHIIADSEVSYVYEFGFKDGDHSLTGFNDNSAPFWFSVSTSRTTDGRFWNYSTDAFDDQANLYVQFFYNKYKSRKQGHGRTYREVRNLEGTLPHVLQSTSISVSGVAATFIASEVVLDPVNNIVQIEWQEL